MIGSGETSGGRVLFYFSGHGSHVPDQNQDENDNEDEVLVPYNVETESGTLKNALLDDSFGKLLADVPAKEIFVFIDACHSGSATKNIDSTMNCAQVKFLAYEGMRRMRVKNFKPEQISGRVNYAGLSACQDDESAISTPKGSLFTRAIFDAVKSSVADGSALTLSSLEEVATTYIMRNAPGPDSIHTPELYGNSALAALNLLEKGAPPRQDLVAELESLVDRAGFRLDIKTNKTSFDVGDTLVITCDIAKDGYLNILNASPGDTKPTVLFPNKIYSDNYVKAGTRVTIPDSSYGFKLRATPPKGKSLIVVLHTTEKLNAYEEGDGKFRDMFKRASSKTLKDIAVRARSDSFGAGKAVAYIR